VPDCFCGEAQVYNDDGRKCRALALMAQLLHRVGLRAR
jgi:hypothetical protein